MTAQRHILLALVGFAIAPQVASQTVVPVGQAPYHVPVFSNEYATVLNVFIPPHSTSGYHRHSLDTLGVLIADTERTRQVLGESVTIAQLRPPGAVSFSFYGRQPLVHEVSVTGDAPFHNIVVELLMPGPGGFASSSRDGVPGYTRILANDRVQVWRLALEPGQQAPAITQEAPGIRIVIEGGEIIERVQGKPDRAIAPRRGDFFWQDAGVTRAVQNSGSTRIDLVEVELR